MEECRLILGDAVEQMRKLPAGSVNCVITDPPYNVGLEYVGYDDRREDYPEFSARWLREAQRVCRGPVAVSVGQANLSMWATVAPPTWWLAWWKPAAMGRCVVGFNNWEPIALYGKPKRAVCDVVRADIKPDRSLNGHPCPKPLDWALRQVEMLTDPGDTVLDCFGGSGTTAVACIQTGRNCILIESSPAYFTIAEQRIHAARQAVRSETNFFAGGTTPDLFAEDA